MLPFFFCRSLDIARNVNVVLLQCLFRISGGSGQGDGGVSTLYGSSVTIDNSAFTDNIGTNLAPGQIGFAAGGAELFCCFHSHTPTNGATQVDSMEQA